MSYVILKSEMVDGYAQLESIEEIPDELREALNESEPVAARWPRGAWAQIPSEYKKSNRLGDLTGARSGTVVSQRFREALSPLVDAARVEFLPVAIKDVSGKPLEGSYYLLHVLDREDVIDVEASGGKLNSVDNVSLIRWKKLVVKGGNATIFRPLRIPRVSMVKEGVAEKLSAIDPPLIGLELLPPAEYKGH